MTENYDSSTSVSVLRLALDDASARALVERKKHTVFGSALSRPKSDTIHIQNLTLTYECLRTISGSYSADYLRNATHTLQVQKSVRNVIIGDKSFDVEQKSRFKKAISMRRGTTSIKIDLKEHVYTDVSLALTFDVDGNEIQTPKYKITPETTETNSTAALENAHVVKTQSIDRQDAVALLEERLKEPLESDIEELHEQFDLHDIVELYVPIFEARIRGPKNKAALVRIDAARKKII